MKKVDKKLKWCIIISVLLLMITIAVALILHAKSMKKLRTQYEAINTELNMKIANSTKTTYKALTDIAVGQIITDDLIQMDPNTMTDESSDLLMTSDDIGKMATVGVKAGEILKKSMVTEVLEKEWQEVEYNCVWLSTNLKQYDYVDIRILFPDGTDYIVASKKSLRTVKLEKNNVFLWCTEDEILNINAAIVDANLHGAKIYTTKYVKPEIEEETINTYQPSSNIIDLMNRDPNVLVEAKQALSKTARAEMEAKLKEFRDDASGLIKEENARETEKFKLDTTTSAGSNEKTANNNGYVMSDEEKAAQAQAQQQAAGVGSANNTPTTNGSAPTTNDPAAAATQGGSVDSVRN